MHNRMLSAIANHVRNAEVARLFAEHAKEFKDFERQIEALNLDGIGYKNMAIAFCKSFLEENNGDIVSAAKYCSVMWRARILAAEKGCPVTDEELGLPY